MAGEFKVNGVSFATESGGTLTVNNSKVRLPSSGNGIEDSSGNSVLSESGGNVSLTAKNATVTGDFIPSEPVMFRNKVINGGMKISQRGTSFSFAHNGTLDSYTVDRFQFRAGGLDNYDAQVTQYSMSAAELNTTGHSKALKLATGTVQGTIANNTSFRLEYRAEAQDLQDLQYGTASAKTITLSFWVKSSVTGTYAVNLYKDDTTTRMINKTYAINVADTWEKKTISIVGDTDSTGSIVNDNGEGLRIIWVLATGSNFNSSSSATWTDYTNGNFLGGHVQNGVLTTANANWYVTGVQLEIGSSATPFEHKPTSVELSLAQRYYQHGVPSFGTSRNTDNHLHGSGFLKVTMRATPSASIEYNQYGQTNSIQAISKEFYVSSASGSNSDSSHVRYNVVAEL